MLVEFSVTNYRSIKERLTLSMVAANSATENRCVLSTGFNAAKNLTENTAIYGPNGAGKTNLILAMEFFQKFVVESSKDRQEGESIRIVPFLFSKKTQQTPSTFEIVFVHEGFLFQYGFTLDTKKVHDEWLYATPKGKQKQKTQTWFERNSKDPIKKELKGDKAVWLRATRDNALFLSTAVQLNSEDFKKPFSWIKNRLRILTRPESLHPSFTVSQIHKNGQKESILKFMQGLDASFEDILINEKEFTEQDLPDDMPTEIKQAILKDSKDKKFVDVFATHKIEEGGYYPLPFSEESAGTQRFFAFAGPILEVLEKGCALVVDEIHNSLHPYALRGIISLFSNRKINKKNAQLIFTTHDTNLMNVLERDQIWLMDKGEFGNTNITSVAEFKGRPEDAIEKRYLGGRYGALPSITDLV